MSPARLCAHVDWMSMLIAERLEAASAAADSAGTPLSASAQPALPEPAQEFVDADEHADSKQAAAELPSQEQPAEQQAPKAAAPSVAADARIAATNEPAAEPERAAAAPPPPQETAPLPVRGASPGPQEFPLGDEAVASSGSNGSSGSSGGSSPAEAAAADAAAAGGIIDDAPAAGEPQTRRRRRLTRRRLPPAASPPGTAPASPRQTSPANPAKTLAGSYHAPDSPVPRLASATKRARISPPPGVADWSLSSPTDASQKPMREACVVPPFVLPVESAADASLAPDTAPETQHAADAAAIAGPSAEGSAAPEQQQGVTALPAAGETGTVDGNEGNVEAEAAEAHSLAASSDDYSDAQEQPQQEEVSLLCPHLCCLYCPGLLAQACPNQPSFNLPHRSTA